MSKPRQMGAVQSSTARELLLTQATQASCTISLAREHQASTSKSVGSTPILPFWPPKDEIMTGRRVSLEEAEVECERHISHSMYRNQRQVCRYEKGLICGGEWSTLDAMKCYQNVSYACASPCLWYLSKAIFTCLLLLFDGKTRMGISMHTLSTLRTCLTSSRSVLVVNFNRLRV